MGFLDSITPAQFPGVVGADGKTQTVTYSEKLHIGYRWYDANVSGACAAAAGRNPCVAFPFGHGLSYTSFAVSNPRLSFDAASNSWQARARVTNTGERSGAEVVQVYLSLPRERQCRRGTAAAEAAGRISQDSSSRPGLRRRWPSASIRPPATIRLSVWSTAENKWVTPAGQYTVWLGQSSSPRDLARAGSFCVDPKDHL